MDKEHLDEWIANLKKAWEEESGNYDNWKTFLLWYVGEDDFLREGIIESWQDDMKSEV